MSHLTTYQPHYSSTSWLIHYIIDILTDQAPCSSPPVLRDYSADHRFIAHTHYYPFLLPVSLILLAHSDHLSLSSLKSVWSLALSNDFRGHQSINSPQLILSDWNKIFVIGRFSGHQLLEVYYDARTSIAKISRSNENSYLTEAIFRPNIFYHNDYDASAQPSSYFGAIWITGSGLFRDLTFAQYVC